MRVFPRRFTPGTPLCARGLAEGLAKMAMFWEKLEVYNGVLDWPAGRPRIVCGSGGSVLLIRLWLSGGTASAAWTAGFYDIGGHGRYAVAAGSVAVTVAGWVILKVSRADHSYEVVTQATGPNPASATHYEWELGEVSYDIITEAVAVTARNPGNKEVHIVA